MSLDIKYRPLSFSDVVGQESTIAILRQILKARAAFEQSYLFAGPWGSGKTTLARIMARAMLCSNPSPEGDPCNQCETCRDILENGQSETFVEVDAATNSGKQEINKIKEEIQYSSFSGKRRLYLMDESHQLSTGSLDSLLLPMEECNKGSRDRKLVCIFCTTEPEKMRKTVLSRCAPAFVVEALKPDVIAKRLEYVCQQEGFEYDPAVLPQIAEMTESHIRDALKAIEGIARSGPINRENTEKFLHLDLNSAFLDIAEAVGKNPKVITESLRKLNERVSPITCYERLTDLFMMAYKTQLGIDRVPIYWDKARVQTLGVTFGKRLIEFAGYLANRPRRPNLAMLECDVLMLAVVNGSGNTREVHIVTEVMAPTIQPVVVQQETVVHSVVQEQVSKKDEKKDSSSGTVQVTHGNTVAGVFVDPRARKGALIRKLVTSTDGQTTLTVSVFSALLELRVNELLGESGSGRPSRQLDLGSTGIDPDGGDQG